MVTPSLLTDEKTSLAKGTWAPAKATDLRSPCPMINSLANHGHIARDGRSIPFSELYAALRQVGLGRALGAVFAFNLYFESHPKPDQNLPSTPWWKRFLTINPLAAFGMRRPGQLDSTGRRVLDLDQLALPGAVEHDISLTRRDHQQPQGNSVLQTDLVEELLALSSDGQRITMEDLAEDRKRRIALQKIENPDADYQVFQHFLSCGEISLLLDTIGDGKSVPLEYARVFLLEERLPIHEGWRSRRWWTLGIVELLLSAVKVWRVIGINKI